MNKEHTLLVYSEMPEQVRFFVIPNDQLDDNAITMLTKANDCMVNAGEENEGTEFLSYALSEENNSDASWMQYEHDIGDGPILKTISRVFYSGFWL